MNASPLIVLAKVGQAELPLLLTNELAIPRAVVTEINAGPANDPAKQLLTTNRFTVIDTPLPPPEILAWDLGAGETAVLSFVLHNKDWTAILDDAAARKCARSFSLSVKGTLAVILLAKQNGIISSAAEVIRSLQTVGLRLNDNLIRQALWQTVGETWE
ncbi:DUF3368 domain-containing protein [Anaerolineales bacterium HSG24]|nr:DUF3368 domain-containing protein [Anaerolineales bacterium HSG24]